MRFVPFNKHLGLDGSGFAIETFSIVAFRMPDLLLLSTGLFFATFFFILYSHLAFPPLPL